MYKIVSCGTVGDAAKWRSAEVSIPKSVDKEIWIHLYNLEEMRLLNKRKEGPESQSYLDTGFSPGYSISEPVPS